MKRDPSIHITRSQFEELLGILEIPYFPTDSFFNLARKYSVDSRAVIASNKKITQQIDKITLASHGDANLVAEIIYATRIKLKQRGVRKITQANVRDWTVCKKLAEICNTFCQDFELDTRAGFITYIELGIKRCNGNNRNLPQRLVAMAENINSNYESKVEVDSYLNGNSRISEGVKYLHDYYVKYIANSTGILEEYMDNPEKYIHFCRIHELLVNKGWAFKEYIDAQFEALSFCNGIPTLDQMYGDKAIERFNKYLYKKQHSKKGSDTPEVEGSLWDKIK